MTDRQEQPDSAEQSFTDHEQERRQILLHIAVTSPRDAAELAKHIPRPPQAIHDDLKGLMADGVVHIYEGALRTSASARIISDSSTQELRELFDQVLAASAAGQTTRASTLIALVESGCTDDTLLHLLVRHAGKQGDTAAVMSALTQLARTRGNSSDDIQLLRAEDAAFRGAADQVLAFTDPLLSAADPSVFRPASILAAGAHIQDNRLERAEMLYQHVGEAHVDQDSSWAALAALGRGHLSDAKSWHAATGASSFTSQAAGLHEMTDALMLSVQGNGDGALDLLARSVSTLTPRGAATFLPETPAALAAILAIGRGEPQTAQVFLERALKADLGGEAGRKRHELLAAWALMVQGHLESSERAAAACGPPDTLCGRERLLFWCLQAGIARRRADVSEMRLAWREIRGLTFGMRVSLFDLLPLGEMMVTAARLRDVDRVKDLVHDALEILAQLGDPIAWSAPLHWHGVQAAFQAEDPASLIPHANALVQAEGISPYASTLAQAGSTWLEMLRGDADFVSVEASARALAANGHVWDASRLAGQAALQHPERESALSMMQLARDIDKDHARHVRSAPQASPLTTRELEVGKMVLDGQGYRAIGERLFISPKTVEHHVARIRSRLGATSRGDLLERLHDEVAKLE